MRKTNQKGSVHIVIVITLVLALVVALGFIFWQNFIHKSQTSSQQETTKTTDTQKKSPTVTTTDEKTLEIPEWNIKGTYSYGKELNYEIVNLPNDKSYLQLTTSTISSNKDCAQGYSGVIERYGLNEMVETTYGDPVTAKSIYDSRKDKSQVGDNYYIVSGPQALCADANDPVQIEANEVLKAAQGFVNTLTKLQ